MLLVLIRAIFVLVVAGCGRAHRQNRLGERARESLRWCSAGVMLAAVGIVIADLLTPRKRIQTISAIYIGLIVGIFLTNLLHDAIEPTMQSYLDPSVHRMVQMLIMTFICYVCISTLLQTKDDFRFIIPYVEFSKEVKGARPLVLDTSVIIDGRIADVAETRVIDQPMVIPRFVLQELQSIADSSDKLRRNRGRRGLDILNRLQKSPGVEVRIHDAEIPELAGIREVDQRLVVLAKHLGGKVVTNDYNLNKIARLQGVEVINLNDLANAMKPIVLPGESLTVKLLKRGEEQGQGVGYLDDGTMVVAEQGAYHLGETLRLTVTSVLQTSAGRMIFGRIDQNQPPTKTPAVATAPGHQEAPGPAPGGRHHHSVAVITTARHVRAGFSKLSRPASSILTVPPGRPPTLLWNSSSIGPAESGSIWIIIERTRAVRLVRPALVRLFSARGWAAARLGRSLALPTFARCRITSAFLERTMKAPTLPR